MLDVQRQDYPIFLVVPTFINDERPDRKVRCDSRRPTCGNCAKARRECKGYGMQLSWPKRDDRRAVVHRPTHEGPAQVHRRWKYDVAFLNTSFWDMSLSDALQERPNFGTTSHIPDRIQLGTVTLG